MKELINYTKQILKIGFETDKVNGHDFFAGFPQPYKKQLSSNTLDLLYYSIEFIVKYSTTREIDNWRYDFINCTMEERPPSMEPNKITHWNLWSVLKQIKKELKN